MCPTLGILWRHEYCGCGVVESDVCAWLEVLLQCVWPCIYDDNLDELQSRDTDIHVIQSALDTLRVIAEWPGGPRAIQDRPGMPTRVAHLAESTDSEVQKSASNLLGALLEGENSNPSVPPSGVASAVRIDISSFFYKGWF
jgi:hypothetical protein